jgi:hypothetical protein
VVVFDAQIVIDEQAVRDDEVMRLVAAQADDRPGMQAKGRIGDEREHEGNCSAGQRPRTEPRSKPDGHAD